MRPVEPEVTRMMEALHGKAIPEAARLRRLHKGSTGDDDRSDRTKYKLHREPPTLGTRAKHQPGGERVHMNQAKECRQIRSTRSFDYTSFTASFVTGL
jgi:hypothetical protein